MKTKFSEFKLDNELDIVLAHKRVMQLSDLTGLNTSDLTKFATSVSEICRNCLEYAVEGKISFFIEEINGNLHLLSVIEDKGPGIENLEEILERKTNIGRGRGVGILNSKKLVDKFNIRSSSKGTVVVLYKKLPPHHPPINTLIVKGWEEHFRKEHVVSPYEEIKKQNIELIKISEELSTINHENKEQIDEIQRLNELLKHNNEDLEDFAYTISHDLKSPITNLTLLVSLIKKTNDPAEKEHMFDFISTSISRLEKTISGILEIIEYKNETPPIKILGFNIILDMVLADLQNQFQKEKVEIETAFEVKEVSYIESYLLSIMKNLVTNSFKYRDPSKKLKIKISTSYYDGFVMLKIEDNGKGIDLTQFENKIFKPFTRLTNDADGKGIGLHLVKNMIEKNAGQVKVESNVGVGTTFYCLLKEYEINEMQPSK